MGSFIKKVLRPLGLKAVASGQIPEGAGKLVKKAQVQPDENGNVAVPAIRLGRFKFGGGIATKMNGDTSASSTISAVDRSFKKHKRNNIFGN